MRRFAAVFALLYACACASSAYRKAVAADTVEAYESYLQTQPPDEAERDAAASRLAELAFERAKAAHSVLGYKRFLDAHPEAQQAAQVRALLEGLRFNAASSARSSHVLRAFLHEHPEGAHAAAAKELLTAAEFQELGSLEEPEALKRLVAAHPEDPRTEKVEALLDERDYAQAVAAGPRALFKYLKDYPAGAHRKEAQVRLFELKVRSLISSGLFQEADAELGRNPLAKEAPALREELTRARGEAQRLTAAGAQVQPALPAFYVRPLEELIRALQSPDPLDRWQAAQELSQHVSIRTLDPLLAAVRTARNPRVRWEAFVALRHVLRALPHDVGQYEVAVRLETLGERAADAEVHLATAVLLDLSGELAAAAAAYLRAFVAQSPDPVVLRRWVEIRRERNQHFSAAVAARRLALWATSVAEEPREEGRPPTVADARQLCAAAVASRWAEAQIAQSRSAAGEFPEDLAQFTREAERARKRTEAALADAELALRASDAAVPTCDDDRVGQRLAAGERQRRAALAQLTAKRHPLAALAWQWARRSDPSFDLRAEAERQVADAAPR